MGFLTALGGPILSALSGSLFGSVENIFKSYFAKEISKEEALAHTQQALVKAFAEVEVAYAQSLSSTFASFMGAVKESKVLQYGWLTVVLSQVFVLFVHQIIVPFASMMHWLPGLWKSGTTVEFAYLLLSVCMGAGAIALKAQTGGGYADALRGIIKR